MQMTIANNIKSTISGIENHNTKDFLKLMEEKFCSADKALAGTLMAEHITMKFDGSKSMQQHVLDMTNTVARLKTLGKGDISKRIVLSVRLGSKRKCPSLFAKFLESHDICAKYTLPGMPQQNGMAERRNRTLMEMVRSMISKSSLSKSLWIYALRTVMYLLNRVPSNPVPKTPFELWTERKTSLRHLLVWGCPAEARVYKPREKKLDTRTVSGYFIGYLEKSKGYKFYCPNNSSRIVEIGNAKFLGNGEVGESVENQVLDINKIRDDDPSPINVHKSTTTPDVVPVFQNQEQYLNNEQAPYEENNLPTQTSEPVRIALNKPARVRKSAILDDYIVYLQETDFDIGIDNNLVSFSQAIKSDKSEMWIDTVKEELKSMAQNIV
ncbi:retrovirus-related pol polyprotein from transposon TNT 1-94 [Tanacetum coccineum]